jgi:AAA+ superfamily predicted ATPase
MSEKSGSYKVGTEKSELEIILAARFPLIYVVSPEEEIVEQELIAIAQSRKSQIYFWDLTRSWKDDNANRPGNPMNALERVAKASGSQASLFVLKDVATLIAPGANGQITSAQLPLVREIKNLAKDMARDRRTLVLISDQLKLPLELREETAIIDFALPDANEIYDLISRLVGSKLKLDSSGYEQLIKACQGLSRCRISRVLAKCLAKSGKIDESAIASVIEEKCQTIRETGILEFIPVQAGLESVGGLKNLKQWVKLRANSFSDAARKYGLPAPKGVLLAGLQGTGKSLSAKTIAAEWKLPLLRLDVGRLFGSLVGESETRMRQVIKLAEAISPCVLQVEEIDKCFSNSNLDGDSGTSKRVLGTLLTWMQEKTSAVFVVMTANNVEVLPPELIRKGRIDEVFWLELPSQQERAQIFQVHLSRVRPHHQFDVELLASRSDSFSGAEIEQIIYEAMQAGFSRHEEFGIGDLLSAIAGCVPLAKISQRQIVKLLQWAESNGVKSASCEI